MNHVLTRPLPVGKALYSSLTGISPLIGEELCSRASIDGGASTDSLDGLEKTHLYHTFLRMMEDVSGAAFTPNIIYKDKEPVEFSSLTLSLYQNFQSVTYESVSAMLEAYYAARNIVTRIRQKSSELQADRANLTGAQRKNISCSKTAERHGKEGKIPCVR